MSDLAKLIQSLGNIIAYMTDNNSPDTNICELNQLELQYLWEVMNTDPAVMTDYTLLFALRYEWYYSVWSQTNKGKQVLTRWVTPEGTRGGIIDFNNPRYRTVMKNLLLGPTGCFTVAKAFIFRPLIVGTKFKLTRNWQDEPKETVGFLDEFGRYHPTNGT